MSKEQNNQKGNKALHIGGVMWRIWFLILAVGYILQVFTLIIFPIALIAWVLGLSDNYIQDYIKYTKRVLYAR
jgi:hypothetical protein